MNSRQMDVKFKNLIFCMMLTFWDCLGGSKLVYNVSTLYYFILPPSHCINVLIEYSWSFLCTVKSKECAKQR